MEVQKEFKYEPSISLKMSKEMLREISIGDKVSVGVGGTVVGMRECFDDKKLYDVELKPFNVVNMKANMEDEDEGDSE